MNKLFTLFFTFTISLSAFAQPANDHCSNAVDLGTLATDGTPSCANSQTNEDANDYTTGNLACQSNGNNIDVFYEFVATAAELTVDITFGTMQASDIHILEWDPSATNACGPFVGGFCANTDPVSGNTFTGLTVGSTYTLMISSFPAGNSNAPGTFDLCVSNITPPLAPGQDCPTAENLCTNVDQTVGTVTGVGTIFGNGSEEDMSVIASCLFSDEARSQWYVFTAGVGGSAEYIIDPITNSNDYDWALFDITSSACALNTGSPTEVACNYSGCPGNTGTTSDDPCTWTDFTGCAGSPFACDAGDISQFVATPPTLTAGKTYALYVDNYSAANDGFTLNWLETNMTAQIGPNADYTVTATCGGDNSVTIVADNGHAEAGWTWEINWGDGNTTSATSGSHTYSSSGSYPITLTVTDPLGCIQSSIQTVSCTLPIELLSFDAMYNNKVVNLNWVTASEINNDYYTVERSFDGQKYEVVTRLDAAGTSNQTLNYTAIDPNPKIGTIYYRLKQTDFDGTVSFTEPRIVHVKEDFTEMEVYPNPSNGLFQVKYNGYVENDLRIMIYDATGKLVKNETIKNVVGKNAIDFNLTSLDKGIYNILVSGNYTRFADKIVIR